MSVGVRADRDVLRNGIRVLGKDVDAQAGLLEDEPRRSRAFSRNWRHRRVRPGTLRVVPPSDECRDDQERAHHRANPHADATAILHGFNGFGIVVEDNFGFDRNKACFPEADR